VVIVVVPVATEVAGPLALIVAMPGVFDVQATVLVRSWVVPSLKVRSR
jgi:hypothetical protein